MATGVPVLPTLRHGRGAATRRSPFHVLAASRAWFGARPRVLRVMLDLGIALTIPAVFLRLADADMLFHVVFVLLSIEAFAFDLRTAAPRIAVGMGAVILDVILPGGMTAEEFFVEWPLMFLIAGITAILAARRDEIASHYAALYRQTSDRLLTAQEDERRRLALDLHDGVGQTLTALALTLDAVSSSLPPGHRARMTVGRSRELAASAIDETRAVAELLRPARLLEKGLISALVEMSAYAGLPVTVQVQEGIGDLDELDDRAVIGIFRVVQEALGNAARHSGADRAWIRIARRGNRLLITIRDDGHGFDTDAARTRGLGLLGMQERTEALMGTFQVRSTAGVGTLVSLAIPISSRLRREPSDPIKHEVAV